MSQSMQDKIIQSAIEGLEHLPADIHFNSHKTWAELSTQLPSNKKPVIYWQYAAALIALTLTTFFLLRDESELKRSSFNRSQAYKKPSIKELKTIIPEKRQLKETVAYSLKKKKIYTAVTDTIVKEIIVTATEMPISIQMPDLIASNTQPRIETKQTAIITTQKAISKKYKVVHLNELSPFLISTEEAKMFSKSELKKISLKTELSETQDAIEVPAKTFLFFKKAPLINNTITISEN